MKFNRAFLVIGVIALAVAGFFFGKRFLENREVARVSEITKTSSDILIRRTAARLCDAYLCAPVFFQYFP